MMAKACMFARTQPIPAAAVIVAAVGISALCGAWFFQYVIGLPPCPLCLEQRVAYYVTIPLAALLLGQQRHQQAVRWNLAISTTANVAMLGAAALGAGPVDHRAATNGRRRAVAGATFHHDPPVHHGLAQAPARATGHFNRGAVDQAATKIAGAAGGMALGGLLINSPYAKLAKQG